MKHSRRDNDEKVRREGTSLSVEPYIIFPAGRNLQGLIAHVYDAIHIYIYLY